MFAEYDFFDTPIAPYTVLQDGSEVNIHIRDTATMEQLAVRAMVARSRERLPGADGAVLHCYGRLGVKIEDEWYIHIIEHLHEDALATHHEKAQSLDIEQSLGSAESFRRSRYREPPTS